MPLRIIFMGTPDFAVPSMVELLGQGHEMLAVYSQPPRRSGRGMELRKSPVHERAEQFGIPVLTPDGFKSETEIEQFRAFEADVAIVIAYGLLLPESVLSIPQHGCFNGHASLLPRWRGAAPIQRAIMAGDEETGVSIMKMEVELDAGPVALMEHVPITENSTAGEMHDRLSLLTADMMVRVVAALERGSLELTPQPEYGVTYARKIAKTESRINWNLPAHECHNHVRGLSPYPGAWCEVQIAEKKDRLKVLRSELSEQNGTPGTILDEEMTVACGGASLKLLEVQRAGKQPQLAAEFLRGSRLEPGVILE